MGWERKQTPTAQLYDLPIIGDDLANIGRVIDLYAVPCKPDAELWVYALWHAFPTLFIALTKPELIDINIHKGSHKPRKGRRVKFKADALFRDALIEIPVPQWKVFRVFEFSQRIGWWFLVADSLEDFAINWISMAYEWKGCQATQLVYSTCSQTDEAQGSSLTPASRRLTWHVDAASNITATGTDVILLLNGDYRVTWSVTFKPWHDPSVSQMPFTTYLVIDDTVVEVGETYTDQDNNQVASGSAVIHHFGPPNTVLQIHGAWQDAEKFCYSDGHWSVDLITNNELGPDP